MANAVDWVDGGKSHRIDLPRFTCTASKPRDRGRRRPHRKPWEWEVQAFIRQLKPPEATRVLLLGIDRQDVAAVVNFEYDTRGTVPFVFIRAIAIALSWRGQGGSLADETVMRALSRSAVDLAGLGFHKALAAGNVHSDNEPSQRLLTRNGFEKTAMTDGPYTRWVRPFSW